SCSLFERCGPHGALPSFPTRRSSDLGCRPLGGRGGGRTAADGGGTDGGGVAEAAGRVEAGAGHAGGRAVAASQQRRSIAGAGTRSEEHTSELQSLTNLVCRLLLEKTK